MSSAFKEMHTLQFAQSTIYQLQARQMLTMIPLNARLQMLNLKSMEEDDAVTETALEEVDENDTL